ncbi:NAD(P)-binding domain-containing protein [Microbacterium stercoris]|uniref:NAD(P)-binding domain-containing protein n=1 Tax=Microbacterium stercoris TaxID=2820289 RepID=A0A939QM18_9MICO|nr:NAD(P)-binding domain-containing protein [Microbacterium stercoris]MBO3661956.1 NAD(P)-binding domain-containing protein [Microbacterium stercoris]
MTTLTELAPSRPAAGDRLSALPVAIIGAGPVGLAAAAHLHERGIPFVVFERGAVVGAAVRQWGHTRLFSPWEHLVDDAAARLLAGTGWEAPVAGRAPSGSELIDEYVAPLAAHPAIAPAIRSGVEVVAVTREGMDRTRTAGRAAAPFALRLRLADGAVVDETARAVIDASGTWGQANPLGSGGLEPLGWEDVADRVLPALPDVLGADRERFAGRHTTVVGAGHSAANTLLALSRLAEDEPGTRVSWLIRGAAAQRISTDGDELPDRGSLGTRLQRRVRDGRIAQVDRFEILRAESTGDGVRLQGRRGGEVATHDTDLVVVATGFRPELGMLRELRLDLDEVVEAPRALAPLIDPNEHSCGTVRPHGYRELTHPEQGFFIVGMKSYGRAPTFLLKTGYEQVRSVVAWLAGDSAAAERVELVLPETGVCSTSSGDGGDCCGPVVAKSPQPITLQAPAGLTLLPLAGASAGGSCGVDSADGCCG